MRRKNPTRQSARKSGGPKIKIREKSVLPKTDPKILKEYCYEILEQFSDLWHTPLTGVYNDTKV